MPFDYLSALNRLQGKLKRKLAGRARNPRRWIPMLILALLAPLAAYDAAAHWLLSGPKLRALINADPESLTLDYDEAASFWPGRLTIKNLRIRGSDRNVQWIIRLASARVDYSVLALARRTFRAERLRGTGLSFSLRNKLEPAEATAADVSVLPAVPGFADPPLRSEEVQGPARKGNPWRIDVRTLFIDHFDDIWIDAFHYRGVARLAGGFFLRPGLLARIGPAQVNFERGETRIGHAPVGISVSGTVSGAFEPFEPPRVHGSEVWQKVSGDVKLDTRFERLQSLEYLVRSAAGTRLEDGAGTGTIRAAIERGIAKGEVRLAIQDGAVGLKKLKLQGDADLRLLIPRWNLTSGPLEVSGSRLALSDVRSSGSHESRRWWGRFDIPSGKVGSTTSAGIEARSRDARPLLALLAADLPDWTRGLVNLDDFTATATVDIGPSLAKIRDLDARGGTYRIQGHYLREKANREGAFLIESGALSVGLEVEQNATTIRLLGAKRWFEDQPDGSIRGRNATPPSDTAAFPRPDFWTTALNGSGPSSTVGIRSGSR
jgi:hypothetical protein